MRKFLSIVDPSSCNLPSLGQGVCGNLGRVWTLCRGVGEGELELKEMQDLTTLAAEQKQLRMDVLGQQGEWTRWTEVKDLLQ
jgi:hypothetical protein